MGNTSSASPYIDKYFYSTSESYILSMKEYDEYLRGFCFISDANNLRETVVKNIKIDGVNVTKYINEFWTAKQKDCCSLHSISYRACFKPNLPRFFIEKLTRYNDIVYDPFAGRGTTIIEATLLRRRGISNDINPLSEVLAAPRLGIPNLSEITKRLNEISLDKEEDAEIDLSMFYHSTTLKELVSLKNYLVERKQDGTEDYVDGWIRMIATSRLTGHSPGFFSVYTLPPNQAVTPERQIKINKQRNQIPPYRNIKEIVLKKSKSLIKNVPYSEKNNLNEYGKFGIFLCEDARYTKEISSDTIQLVVTSPPFLDVVQYTTDNWLRCWFNNIDYKDLNEKISIRNSVKQWSDIMADVFNELYRIVKYGGWVAFEVGEVRNGSVQLDEVVVPLGLNAGFSLFGVLINDQLFTKTSNIWGIGNNSKGTNSNRIVIFQKENNRV